MIQTVEKITAPRDLNDIQQWMQKALINPYAVDKQTLQDILQPGAQLGADACLAIYQRSYTIRLQKCLAEQFPATLFALGETLFTDFADAYLQACPSNSYTLYELGRRFPLWLEETRPDKEKPKEDQEDWINFMIDLAHYERLLFQCFDAEGHEEQPWPSTNASDHTLVLQPCLELAQFRYPVAWYYHEVRAGNSPKFPEFAPFHTVILRYNYHTITYPVSAVHYKFLSLLKENNSIPNTLETIALWAKQPIEHVSHSWEHEVRTPWIEAGFFITQ